MSMWYIGQKVVCVKSHSQGLVRSGVTYLISDVRQCECGRLSLNVGVADHHRWTECTIHQYDGSGCMRLKPTHGFAWFYCALFRPLDALTETIERVEKEGAPTEVETPQLIEQ